MTNNIIAARHRAARFNPATRVAQPTRTTMGDARTGKNLGATGGQRGSAVAEFVMVSALLLAVFMGVVQLTLALHVRNTLLDAAANGARYGTLADRGPADGVARTREIIAGALNEGYAGNVQARSIEIGGQPGLEITVRAGVPMIGMIPLFAQFEVRGEAVRYG